MKTKVFIQFVVMQISILMIVSWIPRQSKIEILPLGSDYNSALAYFDTICQDSLLEDNNDRIELTQPKLLDFEYNKGNFRTPNRSYFTVRSHINKTTRVPDGWTDELIQIINEQLKSSDKVEIVRDRWETYTIDFWYLQQGDSLIPYYGEIYQTWLGYLE